MPEYQVAQVVDACHTLNGQVSGFIKTTVQMGRNRGDIGYDLDLRFAIEIDFKIAERIRQRDQGEEQGCARHRTGWIQR